MTIKLVSDHGLPFLTSRSRKKLLNLFKTEYGPNDAGSVLESMENFDQYVILSKSGDVIAILSVSSPNGAARCGKKFSNMIYNVYTTPSQRGKGYMKALFSYLRNDLRSRRKRCMHLEVLRTNLAALNMYKKIGFKPLPVCKGDSIIMRCQI